MSLPETVEVPTGWVANLIEDADAALGGDSNDAEHEARYSIRQELAQMIKYEFDPPEPSD